MIKIGIVAPRRRFRVSSVQLFHQISGQDTRAGQSVSYFTVSPLHRLAVRLRHSRSNTSTEYSLPGTVPIYSVVSSVRLQSFHGPMRSHPALTPPQKCPTRRSGRKVGARMTDQPKSQSQCAVATQHFPKRLTLSMEPWLYNTCVGAFTGPQGEGAARMLPSAHADFSFAAGADLASHAKTSLCRWWSRWWSR